MEKYYKNFILCGEADYYCLICRETFIIIEDVDKHLRWQNHRQDVRHQEYVSKFRKDFIFKVRTAFFYYNFHHNFKRILYYDLSYFRLLINFTVKFVIWLQNLPLTI